MFIVQKLLLSVVFVALQLTWVNSAFAFDIPQGEFEQIALAKQSQYYVSPDLTSAVQHARSDFKEGRFIPFQPGAYSRGFYTKPMWVTFELHNPQAEQVNLLVEFPFPTLEKVAFYGPEDTDSGHARRSGMLYPREKKEFQTDGHVFSIQLAAGQTKRYFSVIQTGSAMVLEPRLWRASGFLQKETKEQAIWGAYLGISLLACLHFLLLYWVMRDRTYLYFVLYHLAVLIYFVGAKGLMVGTPYLVSYTNLFALIIAAVVFQLFYKNLIFPGDSSPLILWIYRGYILVCGVVLVLVAFLPRYQAGKLTILFIAMVMVFSLFTFVVGVIKKSPFVWVFLVATLLQSVLRVWFYALMTVKGDSANTFSFSQIQMGGIFEITVYVAALTYAVYRLRSEKNLALSEAVLAKGNLLAQEKAHSAKLAAEVQLATSALNQANQAKDRFFSLLAHDIRGPIGSLSAMFNQVLGTEKDLTQELLLILRKTTGGLHQMMEDLLDWARSQMGDMRFEPEPVRLCDVVDAVERLLTSQIRHKDLDIIIEVPQTVWVYADVQSLTTVIRNLFANATKFVPPGGQIRLSAQTQGDTVKFICQDTGPGIPEELLPHLFEISSDQRSDLVTVDGQGTGLGLILCAEFIEKNHGEIGVDSQFGQGSRFWFTLPAGEPQER